MASILDVINTVNKELRFGRIFHQSIIAWAFDMSRAQVSPVPIAIGDYARFFENRASATFQLIPANPGFFQMNYQVQLSAENFKRLSAEDRAEIRKSSGVYDLGIWAPEDSTDWRDVALAQERYVLECLVPPDVAEPVTPETAAA